MVRRKIFYSIFLSALVFLCSISLCFANVKINIVAVNASSAETKEHPIKYYLPKELDAEDIVDAGGLKIDYDMDKSTYYLHGVITLAPKESKTIKVEVKDVWRITDQEVTMLKNQIEENMNLLKNTDYYETAVILKDDMFAKLDNVLTRQKGLSDDAERRIEVYRSHADIIDEIRRNAFSIEYLKSTHGINIGKTDKTVKFIIEVKNSSATDTKKIQHQHYLPTEVKDEDVVDPQGFGVRYDDNRQQSYLSKEEEFKPGESKRYEIVIKDLWSIPSTKIDTLLERADRAYEGVKSSEFAENATFLFDEVGELIKKISASQKEKKDMAKYVGTFRTNKDRYQKAEDDIGKLERLLAAVKAKKLEELEKSKVKNILQKLQALRGITAISQAVFGKKPSINTTWKIIWGILAFVAFFTAFHFFTWWRKSQIMGEEIALSAGTGGVIKEVGSPQEKEEEKQK